MPAYSEIKTTNDWAKFWRYDIGMNIIPANTREKKPIIIWKQYQNSPISEEQFQNWIDNDRFQNGMANIPGKVWHRPDRQNLYLIFIDFDKQRGIDEVFTREDGLTLTLQQVAEKWIVEQHADCPNKAHVYFYSPIPFPNKGPDSILGIEIKGEGEHGIAFCTNSIHKDGKPYEIIGTREPQILTELAAREMIQHLDQVCVKHGMQYLEKIGRLSEHMKRMANTMKIDNSIVISEGERHNTLVSFADSLLFKHLSEDKPEEQDRLKEFFEAVNGLCEPEPLSSTEIDNIWHSALKFVSRIREQQKEENAQTQKQPKEQTSTEQAQQGGDENDDSSNNSTVKTYQVYKYSKDIPLAEEIVLGHEDKFLQIIDGEPIVSPTLDFSKDRKIIIKPHENTSQLTSIVIPYGFKDLEEIKYFINIAKGKSIYDLFLMSESLWQQLLVAKHKDVITFYATDTIYSYFQDLFPTTHYVMIIGTPGAGKGAGLVSFRLQGYRPVMASGMSGANLLELLGFVESCQVTVMEDELQNMDDDPHKEAIYKIGYDETNQVPKTLDGNKSSRHNQWYLPYCFKMFAAEIPPDSKTLGGFNDRTFRVESLKGRPKFLPKTILHQLKKSENKRNPKYKQIISKMFYLRKLLLIYRLLHHGDIIEEVETNIDGRALELTSPQIYLFNSESLYNADKEEDVKNKQAILHGKILPALSRFLKEKGELTMKTLDGVIYDALTKELFPEVERQQGALGLDGKPRTKYMIPYDDIYSKVRELADGENDPFHPQSFISPDYGTITHNQILDICKHRFSGYKTKSNGKRIVEFYKEEVEKIGKTFEVVSDIEIIEKQEQVEGPEEQQQTFWREWQEQEKEQGRK